MKPFQRALHHVSLGGNEIVGRAGQESWFEYTVGDPGGFDLITGSMDTLSGHGLNGRVELAMAFSLNSRYIHLWLSSSQGELSGVP